MATKIARKEQAQNTKKKLLETAIDLFKKHGYEKVTIEQICREANVTTGAFYHHLRSKAGVIVEGYTEFDDYIQDRYEAIITQDLSSNEKILLCVEFQSKFLFELGVEATTEIYKTQITEENKFFLDKERGIMKAFISVVTEGQQKGELSKEIDELEFSEELLLVLRGVVYNWCQHLGTYDLASVSRRVVNIYYKGYLAQ